MTYTTVSNRNDLIVEICVKVPSEFAQSFPHMLQDLKKILAAETGMDIQYDTDK